jgi:hypothetical protein
MHYLPHIAGHTYQMGNQMARAAKRSRPVATFKHSLDVEVYRSRFELLESVRHLDIDGLARAAGAEIELGHVAAGCCKRLARAEVRKGMVTRILLEPCAERPRIKKTPELTRLVNLAVRRAAGKRRRLPLPLPVRDFLSSAREVLEETIICIHICILGHCLWCCFYWEGGGPNPWGYLDCNGWIVGPFPPLLEA